MFSRKKNGRIGGSTLNTGALIVVLVVVLFQAYAELVPEAQDAGQTMNATYQCETVSGGYYNDGTDVCQVNTTNTTSIAYDRIPLAGFFSSTGVVFIIVMASFLVVIMRGVLGSGK